MSEQTSTESNLNHFLSTRHCHWCEQVQNDVVVITGIQTHSMFSSCLHNAVRNVKCSVTIEWSDFDSNDVFDFAELFPKIARKNNATNFGE